MHWSSTTASNNFLHSPQQLKPIKTRPIKLNISVLYSRLYPMWTSLRQLHRSHWNDLVLLIDWPIRNVRVSADHVVAAVRRFRSTFIKSLTIVSDWNESPQKAKIIHSYSQTLVDYLKIKKKKFHDHKCEKKNGQWKIVNTTMYPRCVHARVVYW